jgi:hypothetical protein
MQFIRKVAEAEVLTSEVQKGDVHHSVRIARSQGFDIQVQDIWDAIVEFQKDKAKFAANVPSWIVDRMRVAFHD